MVVILLARRIPCHDKQLFRLKRPEPRFGDKMPKWYRGRRWKMIRILWEVGRDKGCVGYKERTPAILIFDCTAFGGEGSFSFRYPLRALLATGKFGIDMGGA